MKPQQNTNPIRKLIAITSILCTPLIPCAPATGAESAPANSSYEAHVVGAFLLYCLPALSAGDSVARVAQMQKLPELSPTAETAFLNGKPGKVFGVPAIGAGAVLAAPDGPLCQVIVQKLDPQELLKQVGYWFEPNRTPWKIIDDQTLSDGEISRKYTYPLSGKRILLVMHVRPQPVAGGIQALMTAGVTGAN